jgi:hypothetical protein
MQDAEEVEKIFRHAFYFRLKGGCKSRHKLLDGPRQQNFKGDLQHKAWLEYQ